MKSHLIELERMGLAAVNAGRLEEAANLFETIVKEDPSWEHGTALYSLACCYEDIGKLTAAEERYREALRYEPRNPIFLGGLASFLYLHGDARLAFDAHVVLLSIQRSIGDRLGAASTEVALRSLGKRIGMSDDLITAVAAGARASAQ